MNLPRDFCGICLKENSFLIDLTNGQIACSNCGVVSDERFIDETAEWRNLSNEKDACRVGMSSSEFNKRLDLDLIIHDKKGFLSKKRKIHSASLRNEQIYTFFYQASNALELKKIFIEKGLDLLNKSISEEQILDKRQYKYLIALIIYNTLRSNESYKSLSDILKALNLEKKTKILMKFDIFLRNLTNIKNYGISDNIKTMKILCDKLNLSLAITNAALSMFEKVLSSFIYDDFIPKIIAAATILFTLKLHSLDQPDINCISETCGIDDFKSLNTIYNKIVRRKKFKRMLIEYVTEI